MNEVRLELPYPPTVNTYWRANGHRRYISPAGVKFTQEVSLIVKTQKPKTFGDKTLAIRVMIHPRSRRKFDLDNTLKAILDALMKAGMYDDDSQIEYIEIARGEAVKKGAAVIHLCHYKPNPYNNYFKLGEEHGSRL
jgi:crossover junction endodeoxyribonuclease RusA